MPTPRQRHALPSQRGTGPAVGFARRRARARQRLLALGALAAVAGLGIRGADTSVARDAAPEPPPQVSAQAAGRSLDGQAPETAVASAAHPVRPFAEVDGMTVALPSTDVLLVGYHEASLPGAVALDPVGQGRSNANTTRFTLPEDREHGVPYHVMSSRGRVLPPTSAVDIVMRDDDAVLAPVDGVVTEVRGYHLYDTHPDTRIEIRPDDAPHLRVVLIHVDGVQVEVGDRVTTGATVLADTANRFPFSSHVDRYLESRWPHVHLEVKDPARTRD